MSPGSAPQSRPALALTSPSETPSAAGPAASEGFFTPGFWLLLAVQTAFGLGVSTFLLLPKFLTSELGASAKQIGLVTAIGSIAGVLMYPVVGTVSDRTGRKPFILFGSVTLAITSACFHAVHEIGWLLYGLGVVRSVAFAAVFNSTTTLVTEQVAPEKMAQALGIFGVALLSTHAVAPAAAELISERYGWGPVFTISCVLGLIALALALGLKERSRHTTHTEPAAHILALLARPRTRRVTFTIATAGAGFGTLFVMHQPFALSVGITRISSFFVAYALAAVFVRVFFGTVADRFGRQRVSAISLLAFALSITAMSLLRDGLLAPIGAVFGMSHGILYPAFNALAVEGVSESERGKIMSLYHGGFNAGQTLMVPVFGVVADSLGYRPVFVIMGSLALAMGVWLYTSPIVAPHEAHG